MTWGSWLQTQNTQKLEKVQVHAARIVTGALQTISIQHLYKETGCKALSARRYYHCLCLFYKITNGLTPAFLSSLIPDQPQHRYNLRNATGIPTLPCRTNRFSESFIPATIKLWNGLPENVRQSETLNIFKQTLTQNLQNPIHCFILDQGRMQFILPDSG